MENNSRNVLLYGAGGHGKVVTDCLNAAGFEVKAFFDDNPKLKTFYSIPLVGSYNRNVYPDFSIIISIGNNPIRKRISNIIKHKFCTVIHPSAVISSSATVDSGTIVIHGAVIQASACIGRHCIVNTLASLDHDCRIGDFVHIAPHATLCGNVTVGEGAFIGAGATIIQGVNIGKWAVVGAGAAIIDDVPEYSVVTGVPGKVHKYIEKELS